MPALRDARFDSQGHQGPPDEPKLGDQTAQGPAHRQAHPGDPGRGVSGPGHHGRARQGGTGARGLRQRRRAVRRGGPADPGARVARRRGRDDHRHRRRGAAEDAQGRRRQPGGRGRRDEEDQARRQDGRAGAAGPALQDRRRGGRRGEPTGHRAGGSPEPRQAPHGRGLPARGRRRRPLRRARARARHSGRRGAYHCLRAAGG